jgi:hypothetical protein
MQAASGTTKSGAGASLEIDARQLAGIFEKHRILVLLALTLLYALGAVLHARSKPLWYDEIITVIAASASDTAHTLQAAGQTDASPPLPHLLTHYAIVWFGKNDVSVRLPAILGFWVFCWCMFRFTKRRLGIFYALSAFLLPAATDAYTYSVEARAYGLELAFCGLALVAWQSAAEGVRRALMLSLLSLSLMGAVLCHYYAVLLYVPLAGAEAFRSYRVRKVDWGIWLAFAAGGIPVVWRMATLVRVIRGFSQGWAPPYPEQVVEFWEGGLQHTLGLLALLLALTALLIIAGRNQASVPPSAPPDVRDHELMVGVLFLVIPVLGVLGALLVTHMLALRYILFALAGFVLLVPMIAAYLAEGRALPGFLLFVAALAGLGYVTIEVPGRQDPFTHEPILEKALQEGPVVIPDGQLFLKMWYYTPESLKSRLLFLADEEAASRYMGFATIDSGLRALTPLAPIQVMEYKNFVAPGREFLVYQNILRPGWLLSKVVDDGGSAKIEKYATARMLVRARLRP